MILLFKRFYINEGFMANSIILKNNIKIKIGDKEENRTQNIHMATNESSLFSFRNGVGDDSQVMSIDSRGRGDYVVKLKPEAFIGIGRQKLSESKVFKVDESGNLVLDITPGAISITKRSNEELVIKVNSEGKTPYTIVVNATAITLTSGEESYICPATGEDCIDITMQTQAIEMMMAGGGNNVFKQIGNIREIPANLMGAYFSLMKDNSVARLNNGMVLTRCKFSDAEGAQPYCFIRQKVNGKDEILLFADGRYTICSPTMLAQYSDENGERKYNLVLEAEVAKRKTSYNIPIEMDEKGETLKATERFDEGYRALLEGTGIKLSDKTIDGPTLVVRESRDALSREMEGGRLIFGEKDDRSYSKYRFAIKPRTLSGELPSEELYQNSSEEEPEAPAIEAEPDSEISEPFSATYSSKATEGYTTGVSFVTPEAEPAPEPEETPEPETELIRPAPARPAEPAPAPETPPRPATPADDTGSPSETPAPAHEAEGERPAPATAGIATGSEPTAEGGETEAEEPAPAGDASGGDSVSSAAAEEERKKKFAEAQAKAAKAMQDEADKRLLRAKNEKFKQTLQVINTAMGESLTYVGTWMLICCMIPGVGAALIIPALIVAGIGLFQSTFADKLVFDPFRRIKHKVKAMEGEQAEEFEARDKFIENEKTLEKYNQLSQEKIAQLDALYLSESGNAFAKEFMALYNQNGVGFVASLGEGRTQLASLENLDNRISMASMLDAISKEKAPEKRQELINTFTTTFFHDLPEKSTTREDGSKTPSVESVRELFNPDNASALESYVRALNEANNAQLRERTLYEEQRQAIREADKYRLAYLSHTDKFTEEERVKFFHRYGIDILKNNALNQNGSSEGIDMILEVIPDETSKRQTIIELDNAAATIQADLDSITEVAKASNKTHEEIDTLRRFVTTLQELEKTKPLHPMSACVEAETNFLRDYTLTYYGGLDGSRLALSELSLPSDITGITATHVDELNTIIKGLKGNNLPGCTSADISFTGTSLAQARYDMYNALNHTDFYSEVAELYASGRASSLLPNPQAKNAQRSGTIDELAERLAKEHIIDMLIDKTELATDDNAKERLRAELTKLSANEIIGKYKIRTSLTGTSLNYTLPGESTVRTITGDSSTLHYVDYITVKGIYEKTKCRRVAEMTEKLAFAYDGDLVTQTTIDGDGGKKYTRYVVNGETLSFGALKKQYIGKYPYFAGFTTDQQKEFIRISLALQERQRLANESAKPEQAKFYRDSEQLLIMMMSGRMSTAIDMQTTFASFDAELDKYTDKSTKLTTSGRIFKEKLDGYTNVVKIVKALGLDATESKRIIEEFSRGGISLRDVILEKTKDISVDGKTILEILKSHATYAGSRIDKLKYDELLKLCEELDRHADDNAQTDLARARSHLGEDFTRRELKLRRKMAKGKQQEFYTTAEFFANQGVTEVDGKFTSRILPGETFDSRKDIEDAIASRLAGAKNGKARENMIKNWLSTLGMDKKEYDKQRKKFLTKKLTTPEAQALEKGKKAIKEFKADKQQYNKALEEVNKWLNGELTRKPRIGFAGEFGFTDIVSSQKYGLKKGLGVDVDKIQKILDNDKLSDEQKRKKIQKLVNKYEKQLRIKEHRLTAEQQVREDSIYGATHEDRQAMAIKAERDQYERASKKVNAKLEKLLKWAQNKDNAEALNMQELINAVANGDTEYLTRYYGGEDRIPEELQGLIEEEDVYLFDELGVDIDELSDDDIESLSLRGKSPKAAKKIKEKAKARNAKLTRKLSALATKTKEKTDKNLTAKRVKGAKAQTKADEAEEFHKTELQAKDRSVVLNAFNALAGFLGKKKQKAEAEAAAAHSAPEVTHERATETSRTATERVTGAPASEAAAAEAEAPEAGA